MAKSEIQREALNLSAQERIELVVELWDSLAPGEIPVPDWQRDLIRDRLVDRPPRFSAEVPVLGLRWDPARLDRSHRRRAPIARPEDMATASLSVERDNQEYV